MYNDDADFKLHEYSELDDSQLALVHQFSDLISDPIISVSQKERQGKALINAGMPLNIYTVGSEKLLDEVCAKKLEGLADFMIDEGAMADYDTLRACIRHEACPNLALRMIGEMREEEHDLESLQMVIDESFEKNSHSDDVQPHPSVDAATAAFAQHVLLPAAMLDAGYAHNPIVKDWFENLHEEQVLSILMDLMQVGQDYLIGRSPELLADTDLSIDGEFAQQLFRPTRLARTWNHPAIGFPQTLLTAMPDRAWHPLFETPYIADNGYSLHCVTDSRELDRLGKALDNCLDKGEYAKDCCSGTPLGSKHLLCIQNPRGKPVAIAEIDVSMHGMRIVQAELSGARILKKGEAMEALQEWKRSVEDRLLLDQPIVTEESMLGETPDSKTRWMQIPAIYRTTGYEPDWEHVNRCFDDYKRPARRASTGRGKSNSCSEIVYDDKQDTPHLWTEKVEDGYTHMNHFIPEVTYSEGTAHVSMRNMDIQNWLVASGLIRQTREILDEAQLPEADYEIDPDSIAQATRAVPQAVYRRGA